MTPIAFRLLGCGDPRRDIPEVLTRRQVRLITAGVFGFDLAVAALAVALLAHVFLAS